ncbi:hypothetical protein D3C76_583900 [compost metagenome]
MLYCAFISSAVKASLYIRAIEITPSKFLPLTVSYPTATGASVESMAELSVLVPASAPSINILNTLPS